MKSKFFTMLGVVVLLSMVLAACQPVTVTVEVTKEVKVVETKIVEQTSIVKETSIVKQTSVVKETEIVEVEQKAFTTLHPILSDLKVRQAIAYCSNRLQIIQSVYGFLPEADQAKLLMNTNITKASWANYDGDEIQKYPFDIVKGKALLDEAGWTLPEGAAYRENANGDQLSLKFTTTNAAFRQTWAAVFESNMKDCGLMIVRLHAPASWWFGATTGLKRRDFELGAFAWVGETDPKGQTLYACNQIPFPDNGWAGQNSMGWCNQAASDSINAANNTLVRADRIAFYKTFQIEFAKDLPSLPVFQRAEGYAANINLKNFKPSSTEYYTWNAWEWEIPGADSMVLGFSQEPDTLLSIMSSMAAQRQLAQLVFDTSFTQVEYDFQASMMKELATIESGDAVNNDADVKEGDPVVDISGTPVDAEGNLLTLTKGVKIKTADGKELTYDTGTVKMKQLVVTYKWNAGLMWSDGKPVVKADFELAYAHDCDPKSEAVDYSTCQSIQKVDFTSDTEYVVTYKPGYQAALYFLAPIGFYPSHQVLADGTNLKDTPVEKWSALKEMAETPLSTGPYVVKNWEKGVKIELEANPYYWRGVDKLKIKKITILIVQDTNQVVAQLLTGDVDAVDSSTLGAGAELELVLKNTDKLQVLVAPSATWEHIDFNLYIP